MLRVAVNATPLLAPLTGVGNYIVELGRALAATGEVDLHAFYGVRWRHEVPQPPPGGGRGSAAQSLREAIKPLVPFRRELRAAQQRWIAARGFRRYAIDLYHEPNYVPVCYDVPVVTTVHDLSWLRYPDAHPADRVRWLDKGLPRALERSAAILVDSEFVRQEVLTTFGIAPDRMTVAHLGVGEQLHPRTPEQTAAALAPLDLDHGRYLLTVGTIEPRKNLAHTLEAYALLPAAQRERFPLVVAGAKGWRAGDMEARLRRLADRGQIRFPGHVPARDLPALYAGAAAFVFPSLYEGFGLPPLEAMASGVPVLVSDRASLPEVVGDAGILLDPERPERTAELLAGLLDNEDARTRLGRAGSDRARAFTWAACARTTLEVYRRAL